VKWGVIALACLSVVLAIAAVLLFRAIVEPDSAKFGTAPDEAKAAGRTRQTLPALAKPCAADPADCGYFGLMDKGLLAKPANNASYPKEIQEVAALTKLTHEQVRESASRGQIAWLIWTGGNDRFWDFAAGNTAGAFDLLKTISSHKGMAYGRRNRWSWLGLLNEPCFSEPAGPDPGRFGLWLDQRDPSCPSDGFADSTISWRENWRPRQDHTRWFLLRRTDGRDWFAALPQPGFRRKRASAVGPGALLHRSVVLQRS
jgi:hypothetical protein